MTAPIASQTRLGVLVVRAALIAVGSLLLTLWPVMIFAGFLRRFVNGCEWRAGSDLVGDPAWRFAPPRMTCEWSSHEIPTLNNWARLNGEAEIPLVPSGAVHVESFPPATVAWVLLGLFVVGVVLVRIGKGLDDPAIEDL